MCPKAAGILEVFKWKYEYVRLYVSGMWMETSHVV